MKNQEKMKDRLTVFERNVIAQLRRIPRGKVTTYGALAVALGKPGAARAVGRAVGANPFAPAVPCHRVVRDEGSLGGYSGPGGLKSKIRLLSKEGVVVASGRV